MSKLTRTLIIGITLAAMHLAGMTAVAQAQANDEPVMQPPTERQVGETWRHRQVAPENQTTTDPAAQRAQARQRYWYYESMRTSRQQTAAAALQRVLARERFSIPNGTPAQVPAPVPDKPRGQPGWLVASLAVLVTALALSGGLAVLAAKRTRRRARLGHAA